MGKNIIVAGAGHGGLAAAALLAKKGYDVTVYEKESEGNLGYDWTDIFAPGALTALGLPMPPDDKYEYKKNMTFFSPNHKTPLKQSVPEGQMEIKMERRDIYKILVDNALKCGVEFVYDCNILSPKLIGNRVVGINTDKGEFFADLIIDAAGLNSPVRSNLPKMCGVENSVGKNEQFFIYRAFYNNASAEIPDDDYKVYLLPEGKKGIAWVAAEEEYTDVLIGRFAPFDMAEVVRQTDFLRQTNPSIGTQVVRGGRFVEIPVRQPLAIMVCDGYAAIGDSAFMTVPIIGSGIANSLKAARMLVNTVVSDYNGEFSAEILWNYQMDYYKQLGAGLAVLACVKDLLHALKPSELDYLFEKGILTADEFTIGADSVNLSSFIQIAPVDLIGRVKMVCDDMALLKKIAPALLKIGKISGVTAIMPKKWSKQRVILWARRYVELFG